MTMYNLQRMAKEKMLDDWDRTSWIVASIYNGNCKPGKQIKNPMTINPMRMKGKKKRASGIAALAQTVAAGLTRGHDRKPIKPPQPDFVVGGQSS